MTSTSKTIIKRTTKLDRYEVQRRGENWLYLANMAIERGDYELAKRHEARAQKWLDELNIIDGIMDDGSYGL